jgi:hypothetical protein
VRCLIRPALAAFSLVLSTTNAGEPIFQVLDTLTHKTYAFAKRDATWDALVGLQIVDHNFHRTHQALRLPFKEGVRRYRQHSQSMTLGLTHHLWSFQELLTSRVPTPS